MKPERLDKILVHLGIGTRKEIYYLAREGAIEINGEVITDSSYKFDPESAEIKLDGEVLPYKQHYTLIMHKPAGYITSRKDKDGTPIIVLVPEHLQHLDLSPVGRLDKDTEGLLLLTTDGDFLHRLTHPRWKVPKCYYAELENEPTEADVKAFAAGGLELDGEPLQPAELQLLGDKTVNLIIKEGKYHQVKRMFHLRDNEVKYLKRISFGQLVLPDDLAKGEARELSEVELKNLKREVGL